MEFDDSSEKLRRNLIVFCFSYLATAYLGLSLQQVLDAAGLSSVLVNTSQIRINSVLIVVLFYLAFRWFTSENYRNLSREFSGSWVDEYRSRRAEIVQEKIGGLPKKPPGWIFFDDQDFLIIQRWYENAALRTAGNDALTVKCWPVDIGSAVSPKGSRLRLSLKNGSASMNELKINYKFKTPLRLWIALQCATAWKLLKQEKIFEVVPPIMLALSAEFLLVFRLASSVNGR